MELKDLQSTRQYKIVAYKFEKLLSGKIIYKGMCGESYFLSHEPETLDKLKKLRPFTWGHNRPLSIRLVKSKSEHGIFFIRKDMITDKDALIINPRIAKADPTHKKIITPKPGPTRYWALKCGDTTHEFYGAGAATKFLKLESTQLFYNLAKKGFVIFEGSRYTITSRV